MRHFFCYSIILVSLLLSSCEGKERDKVAKLDTHNTISSYGGNVSYVSVYPASLIPFLDESIVEEATLKSFLGNVTDLHFYEIPNKYVYEKVEKRASVVGFDRQIDVRKGKRKMTIYTDKVSKGNVKSLVIFASEDSKYYCTLEVKGNMNEKDVMKLSRIDPAFFERYFQRFNVKF
ncbi:MAG: DUF4252 domain-containing protein [Prevotellaceae bacterium]|jgi:hypothetical protein|nr:DUF4252 domain-containing protein [Prevotellaceae bacterium]